MLAALSVSNSLLFFIYRRRGKQCLVDSSIRSVPLVINKSVNLCVIYLIRDAAMSSLSRVKQDDRVHQIKHRIIRS